MAALAFRNLSSFFFKSEGVCIWPQVWSSKIPVNLVVFYKSGTNETYHRLPLSELLFPQGSCPTSKFCHS